MSMIRNYEGIEINIEKKNIKNVYIRVKAPKGSVHVSAPLQMKDKEIDEFVLSKIQWIKEKQKKYENRKAISADAGCMVWGKRYKAVSLKGAGKGFIEGDKLYLEECDEAHYRSFLRQELYKNIQELIPVCEERTSLHGRQWRIRDMKTRWGTCSIGAGRIWIALMVAEYPKECLEYVMIHELCHLRERGHGREFKKLMDMYCPDWKRIRRLMNGGE